MGRLHDASLQLLADLDSKQEELSTRRSDLFDFGLTASMGGLAQVAFLEVQPATGCLNLKIIAACCKVFEALLPFSRTGATAPAHWRKPIARLRNEIELLLLLLREAGGLSGAAPEM